MSGQPGTVVEMPVWSLAVTGLPQRACAAFAGRCGRRVQEAFLLGWPNAPRAYAEVIDSALALAMESNSMFRLSDEGDEKSMRALEIQKGMAREAARQLHAIADRAITAAAACSFHAALAARAAANTVSAEGPHDFHAHNAMGEAHETAVCFANDHGIPGIVEAVDFQIIKDHSLLNDAEWLVYAEFGVLWPNGSPWPSKRPSP